jgi:hypothetical protein
LAASQICIGRASLGYLQQGIAFRMSYVLGLHLDSSKHVEQGTLTKAQHQDRVRTFWESYLHDKSVLPLLHFLHFSSLTVSPHRHWSSYTGRSPCIPFDDITTPFPTIDPAVDAVPWRSFESNEVPSSRTVPSMASSCFHWTARLAVQQERVLRTV